MCGAYLVLLCNSHRFNCLANEALCFQVTDSAWFLEQLSCKPWRLQGWVESYFLTFPSAVTLKFVTTWFWRRRRRIFFVVVLNWLLFCVFNHFAAFFFLTGVYVCVFFNIKLGQRVKSTDVYGWLHWLCKRVFFFLGKRNGCGWIVLSWFFSPQKNLSGFGTF